MPEFYKKQWFYILFTYWHFCVCAHFNSLLFSFTNGDSLLLYFLYRPFVVVRFELTFQKNFEKHTTDMITRVKKVSNEAFNQMPIGILLYNKDYGIDWANPYLSSCLGQHALAGWHLYDVSETLLLLLREKRPMI